MIDALLAPFYKWIILVLLFFITGYVWYCNSLAGDLHNAETACDERVAKAIKPYEDAIDQAQEEKATIMQTWSAKIIEVEQNAIKKIQDANAAARSADLAASGLSTNVCPQLPKKPSLNTPLPTVSYSKFAQQNIEQLQKKQMATHLMQ